VLRFRKERGDTWRQLGEDDRFQGKAYTQSTVANDLWDLLHSRVSRDAAATCSIRSPTQALDGLLADTPYAVCRTVEVRQPGSSRVQYRLVQLQDVTGHGCWRGEWAPGSVLWGTTLGAARLCGYRRDDGGRFWIEMGAFCTRFDTLTVLDRTTTHLRTLDVKEGECGGLGVLAGLAAASWEYWFMCGGVRRIYLGHSTAQTQARHTAAEAEGAPEKPAAEEPATQV